MRLQASNIGVSFGGSRVLDGIDVAVNPGEVLGLIGPNGAGKSSLLRVLASLLPPDSGAVRYDGRSAMELGRRELSRRIAFLPQSSAVHWPLSVERLVELGRLPHRRPLRGLGRADREVMERVLLRTGAAELRRRSIASLSGGERMRVLVARLLAVEASVLLADEPVASLDPYYQLQFMELFAAEAAQGRAVVVVLHDLPLAARYCQRLLLLDAGRVAAEGNPGHVLSQANIQRVYQVEAIAGRHDNRIYVLPWRQRSHC